MSYGVKLRVWGVRACFTRPELKAERVSYEVMKPSAARGVLEAIHWKPAIRWIVDAIHILNPICFQSIRRNEVGQKAPVGKIKRALQGGALDGITIDVKKDRQQRHTRLLVNVDYVIEAHFEMTARAGPTETEGKHLDMFRRRATRGQCFHQPSLGMREFVAHFELLDPCRPLPEPKRKTAELGFGAERDLGLMLLDIDYDTAHRPPLFFKAILADGVMQVPHPSSPEVYR